MTDSTEAGQRVFKDIYKQSERFDGDVEVYLNLHKLKTESGETVAKMWSVRNRKTGIVLGHARRLMLTGVSFWVSESQRQRVIREKKKTVHALVRGKIEYESPEGLPFGGVTISYNPYKTPWFQDPQCRPVYAADKVEFADVTATGGRPRVTAINPSYEMPASLRKKAPKLEARS